jgi:c-di-GMP-binding flagellar brake protein YcgR
MTSKIKLSVNSRIEIIGENETFISLIQDVNDDGIAINVPLSGRKVYIMHVGSVIEFYMNFRNEVCKLRAIVQGKTSESGLTLILLSYPELIEKIQRREFFRLPVFIDANYYILPEGRIYTNIKDVPLGYYDNMTKSSTVDISGGGIKIITKQNVPRGNFVLVTLTLPQEKQEIKLLCSVVRSDEDIFNKNYKLALRFVGLDRKISDTIIKFIFVKAREQSRISK